MRLLLDTHLLLWAALLASLALLIPAWCAAAPLSIRQAWRSSRPVRPKLFGLIMGSVLLSMAVYAATQGSADALPRKPWVAAAMVGIQRLVDCLLLAIAGHVLAALFRSLTDWQQPEPEDRPFRGMRLRTRKA